MISVCGRWVSFTVGCDSVGCPEMWTLDGGGVRAGLGVRRMFGALFRVTGVMDAAKRVVSRLRSGWSASNVRVMSPTVTPVLISMLAWRAGKCVAA